MAYPAVTAPYGLLPVNLIGGQSFAGATRQIPIPASYATAIFYGDVVKLANTGLLALDTGTDAATPVGVLLGCSYTDATFGKVYKQFYPGAITGSDTVAYVADDPDQLFKAVVVSGTTVVTYVNRTSVGNNAVLVQNVGSTITGNSAVALIDATGTTATWPVRVIDVVPETAIAGNPGSYTEVIVKWNVPSSSSLGGHQYMLATGI